MAGDAFLQYLRKRFGWLLAAALLLPLAQAATTAHAATHVPDATLQAGGGEKAHLQHCPLCTAAAVLGANLLPGSPAHLALAPAAQAAPWEAPPHAACLIRAHLPPSRGPPRSFA